MSYDYENGDGLSVLDSEQPSGSEPVKVGDDALRQVKEYLLDDTLNIETRIANAEEALELKKLEILPVGCVIAALGTVLPDGMLECNGQEVSRTEYVDLFNVIGISYGVGDGVTTFNVPDFRGRSPFVISDNTDDLVPDVKKKLTCFLREEHLGAHNHEFKIWKTLEDYQYHENSAATKLNINPSLYPNLQSGSYIPIPPVVRSTYPPAAPEWQSAGGGQYNETQQWPGTAVYLSTEHTYNGGYHNNFIFCEKKFATRSNRGKQGFASFMFSSGQDLPAQHSVFTQFYNDLIFMSQTSAVGPVGRIVGPNVDKPNKLSYHPPSSTVTAYLIRA